jgi:cobalt/nickel transport protein
MKLAAKLWIGIGALAVLSPIGLILPDKLKSGAAWGEWGVDEIKELIGYVPIGMEKLSKIWNAPLSDYAFKNMGQSGIGRLSLAYIFSALLGVGLCIAVGYLLGKILSRKAY